MSMMLKGHREHPSPRNVPNTRGINSDVYLVLVEAGVAVFVDGGLARQTVRPGTGVT